MTNKLAIDTPKLRAIAFVRTFRHLYLCLAPGSVAAKFTATDISQRNALAPPRVGDAFSAMRGVDF